MKNYPSKVQCISVNEEHKDRFKAGFDYQAGSNPWLGAIIVDEKGIEWSDDSVFPYLSDNTYVIVDWKSKEIIAVFKLKEDIK